MTDNYKKKSAPKPLTKERLERAAFAYLERYASSAENLRRILMRRVDKSARLHDTDPAEGAVWADNLIDRLLKSGILDDSVYAAGRAASMHRRGVSGRGITMKLSAKGVDAEVIETALDELSDTIPGDPDTMAAINYAKRRRIGVFRRDNRQDYRQRDLASLGRQGFSYDIAKKIVDAEDAQMLLDDEDL